MMKCFLLLAASLCVWGGTPYKCSAGYDFKSSAPTEGAPDDATCCTKAAEAITNCFLPDRFECGAGTKMKSASTTGAEERTQATCCVPAQICFEWTCPDGKVVNNTAMMETSPSDNVCCQEPPAFVPDCGHMTREKKHMNMYDFFECAAGTTIDQMAMSKTSPDQTKCCKPLIPTCSYDSGPIYKPVPFACPAGQNPKFLAFGPPKNSSTTNCCEAYEKSCAQINDEADVHQCPATLALITPPPEKTPSDSNCCEPATCFSTSFTCKDAKCLDGFVPNLFVASKVVYPAQYFAHNERCCMPEFSFSGASSLQLQAGVVTIAAFTALLL
jgi:hypothetical protein